MTTKPPAAALDLESAFVPAGASTDQASPPESEVVFHAHGSNFARLPRRALTLWRTSTALFVGVAVLAFGGIGTVLLPHLWASLSVWPGWCASVAAATCGLVRVKRLHARWLRTGYRLDTDGLQSQEGLWRRTLSAVHLERIQSVEVMSGPIQRYFRLASVVVITGSFHAFVLHDVDATAAGDIRDRLMQAARMQQVDL